MTDWWQHSPESNGGPKVLMVFDGHLTDELESQIVFDGQEIVEYRWVPLGTLDEVTIPRLANVFDTPLPRVVGDPPSTSKTG